MSKKIQRFCDLGKFIAKKDKEFYQALDDFCLLSLLRPRRDENGVTFCFPNDKNYRKKIINQFYSKEPEKAVKIIKSLIFNDFYKKPSDFGKGNIVNKSNQILDVVSCNDKEVKLSNGAVLVLDSDFVPMDYRSNLVLYTLKGEMPVSTNFAERKEKSVKVSKKGGFLGCMSSCAYNYKTAIQEKVAEIYKLNNEKDKKNNIYVKKVYLQLKMIQKDESQLINNKKILKYLGNEEISDSYLLDMITSEDLMYKLWNCLGGDEKGCPEQLDMKENIYDLYKKLKSDIILEANNMTLEQYKKLVSEHLNNTSKKQMQLLKRIRSPIEIREVLDEEYSDKQLYGRDLFIVYTNVMKELWMCEPNYGSETFECYSYVATNLFNSCDSMLNHDFNSWKDLTLSGNLLKSDVFKYVPYQLLESSDCDLYYSNSYNKASYIPEPLNLSLFSMNCLVYINNDDKKGGSLSGELLSMYL
jgi:hypothetical protein